MAEDKISRPEYEDDFPPTPGEGGIKANALSIALDVRKFEIELYWKRTQYFWAIIAAAFAGYGALLSIDDQKPQVLFTELLVLCLGLVLSVGWYFANRGSKFWQLNWEKHVDRLEDKVHGPLFKTTLEKSDYHWREIYGPYPYSMSKVNQFVSLFVFLVWAALVSRHVLTNSFLTPVAARFIGKGYFTVGCVLATVIYMLLMHVFSKTGKGNPGGGFSRRP
jgi:hypothetical protein